MGALELCRHQLGLHCRGSPSHLPPLHAPNFPASHLLHPCEGPGCHSLELRNTSLQEVVPGAREALVSIMQGVSCSERSRWGCSGERTHPGIRKSSQGQIGQAECFLCPLLHSTRCLGQWWYLGCYRACWDYWGLLATCSFTADPWYWPPAWLWQGSLPTGRWPCSPPVTGGWPCCT